MNTIKNTVIKKEKNEKTNDIMRMMIHTDSQRPSAVSFAASQSSRALSLRNLVLGYECGRVFPAGVGSGSPSRDAVNLAAFAIQPVG